MDLINKTAREVVALLGTGEVSHAEVLDQLEARVGATDAKVNALPTLCFDRARDRADALATKAAAERGPLGGMPVAIKDTNALAGVRTTHGSPIYADHVPETSDHITQRIEGAGGVPYAKSNVPEFAAGSQTFNPVFGATRNPWNLSRTVGGSSGGAAAALVTGQAWLAQGSDFGGSLRNPASFCGCVGYRPSPGLVPAGPSGTPFEVMPQQGPMARNIGDTGFFLDAIAGPHPHEPFGHPERGSFRAAAETPVVPKRVAYSPDLGITPVDPVVRRITEEAARRFEAMGAVVEEASPDYSGCRDAFQTLRGISFVAKHGQHYRDHRDKLKDDIIWNIEHGLAQTGADVAEANLVRGRMVASHAAFFEHYDLLLAPVAIVPPFSVDTPAIMECEGVAFENYIDWMMIVAAVTMTTAPSLSLPCGFTSDGLPIGLQMIGSFRGDAALLSHAAALEAELALDLGPIDPRDGAPPA
ncbi:MAG: amidase family protein [Pseudomonadota bacterium]